MYFRCTDCYAATWVQSVDASAESQTLKCQTCNRGFTVRAAANLSPDPRAQYETALALAEGNGFDLPTSYSVLLGIMTLEHAMVMRDRGLPAREVTPPAGDPTTEDGAAAAAPRADAKRREIPSAANVIEYDPAFADAVAHGYLSTQQAIERGDRTKFAKRAAELHGLSESLAFMVADNKISVTTAIHKSREEVAAVLRPAKVRTWKRALVAAVGALVLVAVGIYSLHLWSGIEEKNRKAEEWTETVTAKIEKNREPEPRGRLERLPGEVPKRRVRIQKDTEGRVIEIVGPDPRAGLPGDQAGCLRGWSRNRQTLRHPYPQDDQRPALGRRRRGKTDRSHCGAAAARRRTACPRPQKRATDEGLLTLPSPLQLS
jgi:hypothetical protein